MRAQTPLPLALRQLGRDSTTRSIATQAMAVLNEVLCVCMHLACPPHTRALHAWDGCAQRGAPQPHHPVHTPACASPPVSAHTLHTRRASSPVASPAVLTTPLRPMPRSQPLPAQPHTHPSPSAAQAYRQAQLYFSEREDHDGVIELDMLGIEHR